MQRSGLVDVYNMSRAEIVKLYNRIVERINKQITRIKKTKNVNYKEVLQPKDLKRLKLLREKQWKKLSTKELFRRYVKLVEEKPDYRQKAIKEAVKEKKALQKVLGGRKLTARQFQAMQKLVKRANSESALYYQVLKTANDRGIIDDYQIPQSWQKYDTETVVNKLMEKINEDINARNKQRRTRGAEEEAEYTMEEIRTGAWEWEATTGQKRRGMTAFENLTEAQIAEIEKLFMYK